MPAEPPAAVESLLGLHVALVGRLAGLNHRDAQSLLRQQGAVVHESIDEPVQLIVLGEHGAPQTEWLARLEPNLRSAIERGDVHVIDETELWRRLGMVDAERQVQRLYTPRMLAELVGINAGRLRAWRQHGLLTAVREVHRLAYFDFQALIVARRLKELTDAGLSTKSLKSAVGRLRHWLPQVERPLAELTLVASDGQLLLRWGDGLVDLDGQRRIDFETPAAPAIDEATIVTPATPVTVDEWLDLAAEMDERGDMAGAVDACRAALASAGPNAEVSFQLAELFYRQGDLSAARERYYMAVELDENFVEARSNLGCVLAESGRPDLAVAAFEGALAYHADFPDVHYHLARALDELGRGVEADVHWRAFLDLAPDSPWADLARRRLGQSPLVDA